MRNREKFRNKKNSYQCFPSGRDSDKYASRARPFRWRSGKISVTLLKVYLGREWPLSGDHCVGQIDSMESTDLAAHLITIIAAAPSVSQSVSTSLLCDSWNPLPASFVQFSGITPSSSFSSSFLTRRFPITWARSIHLTHPTTSRSRIGFLCIMYFYGFNVLLDFTRTINVFQLGSWFSWIILTDTIIKVNWCQNLTLLWTQRQIVERAGRELSRSAKSSPTSECSYESSAREGMGYELSERPTKRAATEEGGCGKHAPKPFPG